MPDPDSPERAPNGGATALWVIAALLAAGATAVLVLSDDARFLRLAVVAALWAAMLGAFAVAKLRNRIDEDDQRADQLRRIYELELEREIAARQEFELEAENKARREVEEESKSEIEALRAELRNLRESLETIAGGDLLFERVALRAESTRVRSMESGERPEPDNRVISHQSQQYRGRELPAATAAEGNTELMSRLAGQPPSQQPQRPPQPARNGSAPEAPRPQYVRPPGAAPSGEGSRPQVRPVSGGPASVGEGSRPQVRPASGGPVPVGEGSWPARSSGGPVAYGPPPSGEGSRPQVRPVSGGPVAHSPPPGEGSRPQMHPPPATEPPRPQRSTPQAHTPQPHTPQPHTPQPHTPEPHTPEPPRPQRPTPQAHTPEPPKPQRPTPQAHPPAQSAPDEQSHSAPKASRAAAGAHTEGTSVNDLLAAFGNNQESRGHRRRRE